MTVLRVGDYGSAHVEVIVNGKPMKGIFELDTRAKTVKRYLLREDEEMGEHIISERVVLPDGTEDFEVKCEQVYCDFELRMKPDSPLSVSELLRRADVQRIKEALTP